jgi:hypothetical protein
LWRLQNSYIYIRWNFLCFSAGNPAGSTTVDYLVVAGWSRRRFFDAGGGGGAGGYREFSGTACYSILIQLLL